MTKFAVIETGSKQYKIESGQALDIERLGKDMKAGAKVVFDKVLLTFDGSRVVLGTPYIDGAEVKADFVEEKKTKKVYGLRFINKTRRTTTRFGHRQIKAKVKVAKI